MALLTTLLLLVIAACVGAAVVAAVRSVLVVGRDKAVVVEDLRGRVRTLDTGLNLVNPTHRIRATVDLRSRSRQSRITKVTTLDALSLAIDITVVYRIKDAQQYVYSTEDTGLELKKRVETTLRDVVGATRLNDALAGGGRADVGGRVLEALQDRVRDLGVQVSATEVTAIDAPDDIERASAEYFEAQMVRNARLLEADWRAKTALIEAEADRKAAVLRAHGLAHARALEAEAQARAIEQVFDAIRHADPDERTLAYEYLQTLPKVATGESNTMWMVPTEVTDALDAIVRRAGVDPPAAPGQRLAAAASSGGTSPAEEDGPGDAADEATAAGPREAGSMGDARGAFYEAKGAAEAALKEARTAKLSAVQLDSEGPTT